MKPLFKVVTLLISITIIYNCSAKPKPIEYGIDNCAFCDMTIMDDKFSAELVTEKGKVFKFDAIECMLRYQYRKPEQNYSIYLIADHSNPGELVDATTSTFLISNQIPSPMGSYLSGYKSDSDAQATMNSNGGAIFNWEQIDKYINNK
jgi:copper chaperone NosL